MGKKEFEDPDMIEKDFAGCHVVAPVSRQSSFVRNALKLNDRSVRTIKRVLCTTLVLPSSFVHFLSVFNALGSLGKQKMFAGDMKT